MGLRKEIKVCRLVRQILFTKEPRIGYVGGYQGHRNLGDEAIYASLKRLFCLANFIDYDRGLISDSLVRHLRHCDLMLMGGGTTIGGHKEIARRWAGACFACAPHSVIFGSGVVEPMFRPDILDPSVDDRKQWADIIRKCDYVGVRGPMSKSSLGNWGIHNVEVIGDPVLTLALNELPRRSVGGDAIGFNVGHARGNVWGSEECIFEQFAELAKIVSKAGFRVKWFVVWPDDLAVTRQVVVASGVSADIYEMYEDLKSYLDMVALVEAFVGMKLHAVALATCAYVPSVMLEYAPKCRDYMESIEQGENTLRTDKFEAHRAWEMVGKLLVSRSSAAKQLFVAIDRLRKLQMIRASEITEKYLLNRKNRQDG